MLAADELKYVETTSKVTFSFDDLLIRRQKSKFLCPIIEKDLLVQGAYDTEVFQYLKIELQGCKLPESDCLSDSELSKITFDIVLVEAYPDIMGKDKDQVIRYERDATQFFYLDPSHTRISDFFFMESTIRLKDNYIDIFEITEVDLPIIEQGNSRHMS